MTYLACLLKELGLPFWPISKIVLNRARMQIKDQGFCMYLYWCVVEICQD